MSSVSSSVGAVPSVSAVSSVGATSGNGTTSIASGSPSSTDPTPPDPVRPEPPAAWSCTSAAYGDGVCDCGCFTPDPDCADANDINGCERCDTFGSCATDGCERLNTESPVRCTPEGWLCSEQEYADGVCHCGCGVIDIDCVDSGVEACANCDASGSCGRGECPSSIQADDNSRCFIPEGWACPTSLYGDDRCHCGCGVIDVDCDSASSNSCEICSIGCGDEPCPGPIDPVDNTICTQPPRTWLCDREFYRDGSQCHCGCGAPDPDCEDGGIDACDRCNFKGSCSVQTCPGTIDPDNIATCIKPLPPAEWTCGAYAYADGRTCHCGCGAMDLDCVSNDVANCDDCYACGYALNCDGRVQVDDISQCIPPPDGWTCIAYFYADGYQCNCGCGAPDPDCDGSLLADRCDYCPEGFGSCADDNCSNLFPEDNTRCIDDPPVGWSCNDAYFGDGECDCGCAAHDIDCETQGIDACKSCNLPGSCSREACPGSISPQDNSLCGGTETSAP